MSQKEGRDWFLHTFLCQVGRSSSAKWHKEKQERNRWLLCRKSEESMSAGWGRNGVLWAVAVLEGGQKDLGQIQ